MPDQSAPNILVLKIQERINYRTDTDSTLRMKMDGVSRAVSHELNTTPSSRTGGQHNLLYIIKENIVLSHLDACYLI